jgi:hypothetical protein
MGDAGAQVRVEVTLVTVEVTVDEHRRPDRGSAARACRTAGRRSRDKEDGNGCAEHCDRLRTTRIEIHALV